MADDYHPFQAPTIQGIKGLNSVMVNGLNLQVACGVNHQLALGSNLQLCVNPAGLLAGVPGAPGAAEIGMLLGAGSGGNMQFTIGTSTNFVMGQSIGITLGPPPINIATGKGYGDHLASSILCGVLGVATIAFVIAYNLETDNHPPARVVTIDIFQGLVEILLLALMEVEYTLSLANDDEVDKALLTLYGQTGKADEAPKTTFWGWAADFGLGAVGLAVLEAPFLGIGIEAPDIQNQ